MWDSLRAAAIAITPDMSSPSLVRLFLAKLQARVSANARRGSKRDTACYQPAITHARKSGPFYLSEDTLLCLRPSHSAVMPSVVNELNPPQRWLLFKLPGTNHERFQK